MLVKFLCRIFHLIPRDKTITITELSISLHLMAMSKKTLKKKYDDKEISEWSYYKKLWQLMGRLSMLEELIDKLVERK